MLIATSRGARICASMPSPQLFADSTERPSIPRHLQWRNGAARRRQPLAAAFESVDALGRHTLQRADGAVHQRH